MEYYETIIVGGGPAGSSCAWQLNRQGKEVLILEKQTFPRLKLCGGWISSQVMKNLELTPDQYPHSILKLNALIYIAPIPFPILGSWCFPWRKDYSIRRIEFDDWLVRRSQATMKKHHVKKIEQQGEEYIIDEKYRCKYLLGAGGTACPVRRHLFPDQRIKANKIITIEKEFEYPQRDDTTHLFFLFHGLRGYSWYIPKENGFVNIGLGGSAIYFSQSGTSIQEHFQWFLEELVKRKLLDRQTSKNLNASGHGYYLFSTQGEISRNNCFLIGDSAGLATLDLAEGINPAIESGLMVANEILGKGQYIRKGINCTSLNPFWQWLQKIWAIS